MSKDKLFCPKCGEEIDKDTYIAKVRDNTFYDCNLCGIEVYVICENEKEIKVGCI